MTLFAPKLVFAAAGFALALGGASPALAATPCHCHKARHHVVHHAAKARGSAIVRIAQEHLANLGYYSGGIDGVMGTQTRAAIRKFQREHGLKADGVLGSKTNRALARADHNPVYGTHSFQLHETVTNPEIYGAQTINPDFTNSLSGGTKAISSRFARVDVSESGSGASKRYDIKVNGQPILIADGQPSVVGISPTYDLGDEDAVIFTTFSPNESGCVYSSHVLALSGAGSKLLDIDSCTREYDAVAKNGSLFITFPQKDSGSAVGSAWRLEGTVLNRL